MLLARRNALSLTLAAALAGLAPGAGAATDISDLPLASSATVVVKPNILYILDDSGSMDEDAMPDEMTGKTGAVAYRSHRCNTIYYNPGLIYVAPPKFADGTKFANQGFTTAKSNGYNAASGATDLSTGFRAHSGDTAQPAYYYVLSSGSVGSGPLDTACQSSPNASSSFPHGPVSANGATWTKVRVSSTSGPGGTDERTNFANWYSYYRTRLMMMKAATGRSFVALSTSYRVGLITINPGSPVGSGKYLRIADYDASHKQAFLDKLYLQATNGATPLREALSRAGWIYAGQLNTGLTAGIPASDDPMQYACQQNFSLLTTDGYWNGNRGVKLDGTPVGNSDSDMAETGTGQEPAIPRNTTVGVGARPIFDSSYDSTTTTTTTTRQYFYSTSGCSSGRQRIRYNETVQQRVQAYNAGSLVSDNTTTSTTNNVNFTSCVSNPGALPSPNPSVATTTASSSTPGGGATNSLADVAQYYYKTDLRPNDAQWPDKVPASGSGTEDDRAPWQHMTTFTLGLGIFGQLQFHSDYKTNTDPNSTFNRIRSGALDWPAPPDSTAIQSDPEKADDLWHTAVNGRGQAFSASNPDQVVTGLNSALSGMNARVASASAAATSNLEPVAGDNFAFTASYETVRWVGELQAREIDLATGTVQSTPVWSAAAKLDARTRDACDTRTIHLFRSGATNNLVPFKWASDGCDSSGNPSGSPITTLNAAEQAMFDAAKVALLSQYGAMTDGSAGTVNQRSLAAGANLVNFVRGQRGKEGFIVNNADGLYRERFRVLGDIVNAQPLFVKAPFAQYADAGYTAYKAAHVGRTPMVYVGANDGMLHAFYAGTSGSDPQGGDEAWAFIPSMVLPELSRLVDTNYASLHKFYVDGTPVAGDVYDPATGKWKTILVAGLNKGGTGYYALDITNPAAPKGLWEFKYSATCFDAAAPATHGADCNLGYSYGNPAISKLADGTWVVFVSSGYNNVNGDANDGKGYLYVLNAVTGRVLKKIGTGAGSAATPSGLGKINNWVDDGLRNNTTVRVYGADLLGNLWRFDVNGASASGSVAQLLATAKDAGGNPQSVTTKLELASIGSPPQPVVYAATGRYLGASDVTNTQVQSVYALRDPLTTTAAPATQPVYTDLRSSLSTIAMTNAPINGADARTATCNANCVSDDGWYADLPDPGERVNVDMRLQLGTLTVLSNVPQNDACNIGGYSYVNYFDYRTGLPVASSASGLIGIKLANSLAVGLNIVRLPTGKTVAIATTSDAQQRTVEVPIGATGATGRRVSWRELGD